MPGNLYITTADFPVLGLPDSTDPAMIRAASDLVDSFCQRPSLFVTQYTERNKLPQGRPITRVTYTPLAAAQGATSPFVAVRARIGIPRGPNATTLAEMLAPFGGPPAWVDLDASQVDFDAATGELWLPAGIFGANFTEAEITYTAGFAEAPEPVKLACAQVIRNLQAHPAAGIRTAQLDQLQLEYFAGSLLDDDVRRLLAPFVAVRLN